MLAVRGHSTGMLPPRGIETHKVSLPPPVPPPIVTAAALSSATARDAVAMPPPPPRQMTNGVTRARPTPNPGASNHSTATGTGTDNSTGSITAGGARRAGGGFAPHTPRMLSHASSDTDSPSSRPTAPKRRPGATSNNVSRGKVTTLKMRTSSMSEAAAPTATTTYNPPASTAHTVGEMLPYDGGGSGDVTVGQPELEPDDGDLIDVTWSGSAGYGPQLGYGFDRDGYGLDSDAGSYGVAIDSARTDSSFGSSGMSNVASTVYPTALYRISRSGGDGSPGGVSTQIFRGAGGSGTGGMGPVHSPASTFAMLSLDGSKHHDAAGRPYAPIPVPLPGPVPVAVAVDARRHVVGRPPAALPPPIAPAATATSAAKNATPTASNSSGSRLTRWFH